MAEMTSPLRLSPLAVLAGVRTPFAKAFGALANVPADQLGRVAVEAVLPRAGVRRGLRRVRTWLRGSAAAAALGGHARSVNGTAQRQMPAGHNSHTAAGATSAEQDVNVR